MNIIIDNRERDLKDYFKDKENISFKNLDIGDIIFKNGKNIILIIERKTLKDFSSSIKDGRYREQKLRLKKSGIDHRNVYYLIEGKNCIKKETKICGISYDTLISSMLSILIKDNFKIIRTYNFEETIFYLEKMYDKSLDKKKNIFLDNIANNLSDTKNIENSKSEENLDPAILIKKDSDETQEYGSVIKLKKKENLDPINCYKIQLSQIPGVSYNIAKIIYDKYPSFVKLYEGYIKVEEKDRKNMLKDISYSIANNKTRKLGKVISNRIYEYLFIDS